MEVFNKANTITTSDDKLTITGPNTVWSAETCYGSTVIDSQQSLIHEWTLRINKKGGRGSLCVGIDDASSQWGKTYFYSQKGTLNYSFRSDGYKYKQSKSKSYGKEYGTGDMIVIILDLPNGHISFIINGESQGIAYNIARGN
eukprot:90305_1